MSPASSHSSPWASGSLEAFKFSKLNGLNYAEWSPMIQAALQAKWSWLIVTGDEEKPTKPEKTCPEDVKPADWKAERKEYLDWLQRDQAAMGLMKGAMEPSQLPHVQSCESAKDMWDTLKRVHLTNQQDITVHYHFESLYTRKYVDGSSMADHIAAMLDLKHKITSAGEELSDRNVARALTISLPRTPTWDVIKVRLFGLTKEQYTVEAVSTALLQEANRRLQEKTSSETALFVQKVPKKKRGPGGKSKGPKPDDICRGCGGKGHWASKCPHRDDNGNSGGSANYAVSSLTEVGSRVAGQVYMAVESGGYREKPIELLLDTGATVTCE